jgi:hypothetical protein
VTVSRSDLQQLIGALAEDCQTTNFHVSGILCAVVAAMLEHTEAGLHNVTAQWCTDRLAEMADGNVRVTSRELNAPLN